MFLQWMERRDRLHHMPPSEADLILYISERSLVVQFSTLKGDLAAISDLCRLMGFDNYLLPFSRLKQVVKGAKRVLGATTRRKLPITPARLSQFRVSSQLDHVMMAFATTAVFGLFRSGELLNLQWSHVQFQHDCAVITLDSSKTDPFRFGCKIHLFAQEGALCPLKWLKYLSQVRGQCDAVFQLKNKPISRSMLVKWIKSQMKALGQNPADYAGHSFRSGGATILTEMNYPQHVIQTLGRWKSEAFKSYCHIQREFAKELARSMAAG